MKKSVGLCALLWSAGITLFAQVDTTFIYNTSMPYGTLDLRIAKSATRYYYLQEDVTFSYRESAPGVKTNTYRDMTSWDSSPYREGNLREKNGVQDFFVMNYRFMVPNNYNPSYSPGYPVIIMFHGLGERGNCWNNNCYWSTTGWNPNTNSPPAPTSATHNLLNNDHNLLHGGLKHLEAVNLAGSRLPDDPSMPSAAFPGFLIFPQNLNGWAQAARVEDAIRILRLMIKKYNIDENRVYVHGLSNGGGAVFQAIKRAPWLFAAALPMSAVNNGGIFNDGLATETGKIPLWIFQGGQDNNPTPSKTYGTVKGFKEAGADVRYYLYPHLGHGTWNTAYKEPDFFPWMLSKRKYNPHVYYGNPVICNTTGAGVRISFSNGFPAYQWELDGNVIEGAIQSQYIANIPGTYRGRFSRKENPSENEWEPWSDPIVVTEVSPEKPTIITTGSTHLRGPGLLSQPANNTVVLKASPRAELYTWYKNGAQVDFQGTDVDDTLRTATFISSGSGANGAYTLKTWNSFCPSPPSDPVQLFFNNSAPQNIPLNAPSVDFKGKPMASGVFLSWNDLATNDSGYEIWRKKSGTADFTFAGRTAKDAISFFDTPLEPNTTYLYKLRAISNTGASAFIPSGTLTTNLQVTTSGDFKKPAAPQELTVTGNTINSVTLSWKAAADNAGIREYIIDYGNSTITTDTSLTTFTLTNLMANRVFPVSVRAVDHTGNVSPSSNQVMASTYVLGLFYKHSTGAWEDLDDSAMVATFRSPEFTGTVSNFTLAPRTQEDFFNFQFTGYLDIRTAGNYIFRLTSNDGGRLLIDNATVIDNDGVHGNVTVVSDTVFLPAGPRRIEVQYFDYVSGQTLTVQYKGPNLASNYVAIPDSLLRSGKYIAPVPPPVPVNLTASSNGMQRIDLSWQSPADVELYRSLTETGPFTVIGRASAGTFVDTVSIHPATRYYYKVRAVSASGQSPFSAVVSAVTASDASPPSVPTALMMSNKTHTHVAITWAASTDNTGVAAYEIFTDGVLAGTSPIPAFTIEGLQPTTSYLFTVKAVDAGGNRSAASAPLAVTTNASAVFYSMASGNLNALTTWKQNANGTGESPTSFTDNGQYFIIANRTQTGLGGPWEVSGAAAKVVIPTGVTLTVDHAFTGRVELEGTAALNLNHSTGPELQKISPASTVNFNAFPVVPKKQYGNVVLSGSGVKTFLEDTTKILGNLTVANGVILKGAAGNATKLALHGNLTVNGSVGTTAADNGIDLVLSGNTPHALNTGGDLQFHKLTAEENAAVTLSATTPIKLTLGSFNGGGLTLNTGSAFVMGNHTLEISHAGTINPGNETGQLATTGGTLIVASSATLPSNVYFDAAKNTVDSLTIDLAGSGDVIVRNAVKISDVIKIRGGQLNATGPVTLLATAEKTAVIAAIENNGAITGQVTVSHFLEAQNENWRDLSSPVSGVTVATWQNFFPITGSFSGSSGGTGEPSMTISNGTAFVPYPPSGGTNMAPIEKGRGYRAAMAHDSPITVQVTGVPHQGSVSFSLAGGSGGGSDSGWNLVGNPYASPITWSADAEAWGSSGVSRVVAVSENKYVGGQRVRQYMYYDPLIGKGTIRAGQGFYVQTFHAAPVLTIHEKAKIAAPVSYPGNESTIDHLIVTLEQGTKADAAYILFSAAASDGFDDLYDAVKRENEGIFNLSTVSGNLNLAINHLTNSFCSKAVNLNLRDVSPGPYTLAFSAPEAAAGLGQITLTDAFTGTTVPVTSGAYSFSVTTDPLSYGASRFTITFTRAQLDVSTPQVQAPDACSAAPAQVTITHAQAGVEYAAINAQGAVISAVVQAAGENVVLEIPVSALNQGDNALRVRAAFPGCATQLLTSQATLNYAGPFDIIVQNDVSVCHGEQVMLQASGVPAGGHYRWFDEKDTEIDSVRDATLVTKPLVRETIIRVAGVLSNGCESALKTIHLFADTLDVPVITVYNDTLFVQVEANYQWSRDGVVISGATQPYLKPAGSGVYRVTVWRTGCSKESDPYTYVIDPGCQVDVATPQVSAPGGCGGDDMPLTVTHSQPGVVYTAVNIEGEAISSGQPGNGGDLLFTLSTSALDSGVNRVRIRADLPGCIDRMLLSQAVFTFIPEIPAPLISLESNMLVTAGSGTFQWKKDGEVIGGATNSFLSPQGPGRYTVTVTQGTCSRESEPFPYLVTDLQPEHSLGFMLNVYPVPAKTNELTINVQSPFQEKIFIRLVDITGRSVFHHSFTAGDLQGGILVDAVAGGLKEGVYCVIATQGEAVLRRRIVIRN